ncbi:phycobilisome linker polypeptide [filamentous cyanobacterium LEGE 11480]|uniref:Phycobilisome linker polypeptide n=1 Tax=Romeriopsis navalis LEGE 11480 TaxID=2777977 RepID=A0A928Z257_9CYAN|nr:phycobilisome linker polypeptide [Romeriopsis navalis]MBE9029194.1 phycobilisome linker polypeptide [Romeriopsis navalis LEGE 11480]
MLGRSILNSTTSCDNRMFVYEISGLRQSDQTMLNNASIRKSSNTLIPIPFSRMNEFMQRINRLGGQIVAIHSSLEAATQGNSEAAE